MKINKTKLSKNGPEFSEMILGVWRLWDGEQAPTKKSVLELFDQCLEIGLSSFDLADIYGNYQCEASFGEALKERLKVRDKIQLISKAGIVLISEKKPRCIY